jgi:hypothetical protein
MNYKTQQIIEMLNQGKSYTQIQSALHVSPSKISMVKQEYADQIINENLCSYNIGRVYESQKFNSIRKKDINEIKEMLKEKKEILRRLDL